MTRSWKMLLTAMLTLAMLATACASDTGETATLPDAGSEPSGEGPDADGSNQEQGSGTTTSSGGGALNTAGINFNARLEPFAECGAYLNHIKEEALSRVGPWGLQTGGFFGGPMAMEGDDAMEDDAMEDAAAAVESASEGSFDSADSADSGGDFATGATVASDGSTGRSFSGTNVQVTGVDEPDIVKTDGNRIISLRGNSLSVVDVTGDQPVVATSLDLGTWGQDMLLFGDTVLVMATEWGFPEMFPAARAIEDGDAESGFAGDAAAPEYQPGFDGQGSGPITTITQVNIAGQARVTSFMRVEGNFVSARLINDIVRLVVTSPPPDIGFVFPQNANTEDIAEQANRQIIEQSTLGDWLPRYSVLDSAGTITEGDLLACNEMHRPSEFGGFSTLSVLTLDIDGDLAVNQATGILADGQTVYASTNNLFVATTVWDQDLQTQDFAPEEFIESYTTSIHQFDITNPSSASYVASGSVPGSMLSQFSLHEWDGRLFVATTEGAAWGFTDDSESFVTVLEPQGENLAQVGRVGNMGRGERIFAVRFIGSNAYVVTFRQVDPLYVVDLSDPTAPFVAGELKVPGFSTYLHNVGDGLLLGVGQDATDEGRTLGAKLSLFDVSNPNQPTELDTWVMPNSSSNVEWDHRAFLWWQPRSLAVMPMTNWQEGFGGAIAVTVSRETGITELGQLDNTLAEDDQLSEVTQCEVYKSQWNDEVQVCGPGEKPIAGDFECYQDEYLSDNPQELEWLAEDFGIEDGISVPDGHTVNFCYPSGPQFESIQRSIVIGDSLWTLSDKSLQRNGLETLQRETRLELPGNGF